MRIVPRFFIRCILGLLSLLLTLSIGLALVYVYIEWQLPDISALKDVSLEVPLRIYTADGKLIAQYGSMRRSPVSLSEIPKPLIQAVLATEDARFYSHPGVDLIGMVRAAIVVIQSGRKAQGASTITMQVARNFFLTSQKTYTRKAKEILLALKIEREMTKDKILELYLNRVYFGYRAYGVAAAAQVYYGKPLNQLTLAEMATLAGLPQAPSRDNPLDNPDGALLRRNHVLKRMLDVHFINKVDYKKAVSAPMTSKYHGEKVEFEAQYVAEMVRQVMYSEYGKSAYDHGLIVHTTIVSKYQGEADHALREGLIAYSERHGFYAPTTNWGQPTPQLRLAWANKLKTVPQVSPLHPAVVMSLTKLSVNALLSNDQMVTIPWTGLSWARIIYKNGRLGKIPRHAEEIVHVGDLIYIRPQADGTWRLSEWPRVQGAFIALNPQNGAVLALSGGFDYWVSKFNRAIQAERQPGSNFKPFIYSAALDRGFTLASVINDAPVVIRDLAEESGLWRPHNDNMKFYGPTRLRDALTQSRNLVSVRILQSIGVSYALNYVSRFGFDPKKLPRVLSLALGSGTVTPVQIAVGYSVFANGGYRVLPYFIQKVQNQSQKILYQAQPAQACEACLLNPNLPKDKRPQPMAMQVLSPQNAYLITSVLQDVIRKGSGTGHAATVLKRNDVAGKTGTSNNQVDAWFSGFNSNIEATAWVGFDHDGVSLSEFGAQAALPIWIQFMQAALVDMPPSTMPRPPGIVTARIDSSTGLLAKPGQSRAFFELFRSSNLPKSYATGYNANLGDTGASSGSGDGGDPIF